MTLAEAKYRILALNPPDFVLKHSVGRVKGKEIDEYYIHLDIGRHCSFSGTLESIIEFAEERVSEERWRCAYVLSEMISSLWRREQETAI